MELNLLGFVFLVIVFLVAMYAAILTVAYYGVVTTLQEKMKKDAAEPEAVYRDSSTITNDEILLEYVYHYAWGNFWREVIGMRFPRAPKWMGAPDEKDSMRRLIWGQYDRTVNAPNLDDVLAMSERDFYKYVGQLMGMPYVMLDDDDND